MTDLNKIVKELIDEIDNISEETQVTYEVWGIGYDSEDCVTDAEFLFKTFDKPEDAVEYAKSLTFSDVVQLSAEDNPDLELEYEVAYISIEVETVIDDEDEGTMNVGTIFRKEIWVSEEETSEEETVEDPDPIVKLSSKDYELDDEGNLIVSRELLKDYNKNDYVRFHFTDENESGTFSYKIISKTTANKFICEFIC